MAENNTDTIQTEVDFYKFLNLLPTALPDYLHDLIREKRDEFHKNFCDLSLYQRGAYIHILSGRASDFCNLLLQMESRYPVDSVSELFDMMRLFSASLDEYYGNPNNGGGSSGLQHQSSEPSNGTPLQLLQERRFGSPDMPRCSRAILAENYGNPNNGTGSTGFQRQRSGPSNGSLVHHDTAGLPGNTAGTDVAISAAGHGTPPYHDNNTVGTDLAISVAGYRSVLKPSHATVLDDITNLMKEIFVSLNGSPQLARDYPKWFTWNHYPDFQVDQQQPPITFY